MDTALSCRRLAHIDLARADGESLLSRRDIWVASAAAWSQRADTLERIGRLTVARHPSHREPARV